MESQYTYTRLDRLWSQLETQGVNEGISHGRKYTRLDMAVETGFRVSCCFPERYFELLIELKPTNTCKDHIFPNWKGMKFALVELDIPVISTPHLSLIIENREHRDVFTSLCADLANDLSRVSAETREAALAAFFDRWTRFFERFGTRGLSKEQQRGLFGELFWLQTMIDNGIDITTALNSWKGCERGYHDFEIDGQVVEVKTTMTKEPRKVRISNERQLDDRGLQTLHLLVLTLTKTEVGGKSLPDIIGEILSKSSQVIGGRRLFEQCLKEAGYLEPHTLLYTDTYSIHKEELFNVRDDFPRIIQLPDGLGDIKYSLVVATVSSFLSDKDDYLSIVKRSLQ